MDRNMRKPQGGDSRELEECSEDSEAQRKRGTVNVGESWPGELDFTAELIRAKTAVVVALSKVFSTVLLLLTCYAMLVDDKELLKECLSIVEVGLIGVGVWAVGSRFLQVISRVRLLPDVNNEAKE